MKTARIFFFAPVAFAMAMSSAMAQSQVVGASPSSRGSLDLFDAPGAAQPVRQIPVAEAGFPLAIQSSKPGYHQVSIGGQGYWLRSLQVRVSRDTGAGCATAGHASYDATIATPGAGKNAC